MIKHKLTRQEKIEKIVNLVDRNPKVDFDPETTTFCLVPCNCQHTIDFNSVDSTDILYSINSFILSTNFTRNLNIPLLGNFGAFFIKKLSDLTLQNKNLTVLASGDIDISNTNLTIKVNYFLPFEEILDTINESIKDIEKHHQIQIGKINYGPLKIYRNGKRN